MQRGRLANEHAVHREAVLAASQYGFDVHPPPPDKPHRAVMANDSTGLLPHDLSLKLTHHND